MNTNKKIKHETLICHCGDKVKLIQVFKSQIFNLCQLSKKNSFEINYL